MSIILLILYFFLNTLFCRPYAAVGQAKHRISLAVAEYRRFRLVSARLNGRYIYIYICEPRSSYLSPQCIYIRCVFLRFGTCCKKHETSVIACCAVLAFEHVFEQQPLRACCPGAFNHYHLLYFRLHMTWSGLSH